MVTYNQYHGALERLAKNPDYQLCEQYRRERKYQPKCITCARFASLTPVQRRGLEAELANQRRTTVVIQATLKRWGLDITEKDISRHRPFSKRNGGSSWGGPCPIKFGVDENGYPLDNYG